MEINDQHNQIPEELKNTIQEENSSKAQNANVDESQLPGENQDGQAAPAIIDEVNLETPESIQGETPPQADEDAKTETQIEETEETVQPTAPEVTLPEPVEADAEETIADIPDVTVTEIQEVAVSESVEPPVIEEMEEVEILQQESVPEEKVMEPVIGETVQTAVDEAIESSVGEEEKVVEVPQPEDVVEEKIEKPLAGETVQTPVDEDSMAVSEETVLGEEDEDEDIETHEEEEDVKISYEQMSREELLESLEKFVNEEDVNKIKSRISLIKVAFLKKTKTEKEERYQNYLTEGGDKEEYHPSEDTQEIKFNEIFDIYRQKRAVFLESLEKEKIDNLRKKEEILEALKELINSEETLKRTYDDFRDLQDRWKDIGMVPKTEVNNLWQNYHFLVERFFDKVKINKELKDLDLKKNLEQKIELCEKAEELLMETSILRSFKQLQRYHDQWKETGPVPDDKKDEIWERFKTATDKINQRRRDHYKKLQDEQENNLMAKTALCEKAESLLAEEVDSIKLWQEKTTQFTDLFKVWKTVGPAPKKANDEVWERFKTALDGFFSEKKEYFGTLKDQQINNYNLKLDLCVQAEALRESTDWRNTTRDLINMQREWKDIGPVPRKNADKIWKCFRTACDEFFQRKTEYFSTIRDEEGDNLRAKEILIKEVEEHNFDGGKGDNLAVLKDFQRRWTEIGHVPFKEKDRLQNAFRDIINKQLDRLNISNTEMSMANYKSRFEVIKSSPDSQRQVYRERTTLQVKVAKLREDIMLWENNIGFLADSKKANLLKQEFEKKIESAKQELEMLENKLKFLNK
jgi:hypothetical protein